MQYKLSSFMKRRFMGVRYDELIAFISFYILFAFFYYITLWINGSGFGNKSLSVLGFIDSSGLGYTIKFIITLPIWWLMFRKFEKWSLKFRLLLHILFLPAFVLLWKETYYRASDLFGFFHLVGSLEIWDIYIPGLFYVLQFGILHAYNYYKENENKIKLEGELRNAALKSELSAIKSQLNPHFLYNIFNTISASIPPENEKTRHLIAQLSDIFRYQLKASQEEKVTLKEELEFVNKYLELEKERFKDRLNIEVNVNEELYNELVPPMLMQPLIENSLKHGISSLIEGGSISICIIKKDEKLHFEIADTGVGIKEKKSVFDKGIGLTNTQLRLRKMYGAALHLSDNKPKGLKISFAI